MSVPAVEESIVTLKPRKALPFFSKHPWLYAGAIQSVSGMPDAGSTVTVRTHTGEFIAYGLYNPASKIRVRLYSWKEDQPLEDSYFQSLVSSAVRFRHKLYAQTPAAKACRLVYSESDGLSGLIVDRFDDWLVLQWTSAALAMRQSAILEVLERECGPKGILLRTERGIRELEGLDLDDGLIVGEAPGGPVFIQENGLRFGVDIRAGQKTGFYYDQRDNRTLMGSYGRYDRLLDVCCYSGGFAIAGARLGECKHVVAVDSSESALELARHNAELNEVSNRITFHCDDAFDFVEQQAAAGEKYDRIVLDPPKLARTRGGLDRALKGYLRLNQRAMECLNPDGILITCSCSGHVMREDFEQVLAKAAIEAGKSLQILEERGQAADHPVSAHCLETSYLKCFVCRVY